MEIKASLDKRNLAGLMNRLFKRLKRGNGLSAIEGFILDRNLVLVDQNPSNGVDTLIFCSPKDGRLSVKRLTPDRE